MRVELHSHTHHSHQKKVYFDGTEPPEAMVAHAKKIGLGAIVITDHNTQLGIRESLAAGKKHGIIVVPGEEIDTSDGHVSAVGINEVIRPGLTVEETVDRIHAQGGTAISTHPFDIAHEGLREKATHCDALEIFNSMNLDRMSNMKALKFAHEHKAVGVVGSDAHTSSMLGRSTINTAATDIDGIINAIKKGRLTVNHAYHPMNIVMEYSVRRLKMSHDHVWNYIEENYSFPKRALSKKLLGLVNRSPGNIDHVFKVLTYTALGGVVAYSMWKNGIRG